VERCQSAMVSGKAAPVVRGSEKARTGKESVSRKPPSLYSNRAPTSKAVPKWAITEYKAPRKISDKELEMARKMFFELDRDGSGSIDSEELGVMLRQMGQNPTEQELKDLINSVDDGDKDGQIQLREFLKLYTESIDAKKSGQAGKDDVRNVFCALGGDPTDEASTIEKRYLMEYLVEHYELHISEETISKGDKLTQDDLHTFLVGVKG